MNHDEEISLRLENMVMRDTIEKYTEMTNIMLSMINKMGEKMLGLKIYIDLDEEYEILKKLYSEMKPLTPEQ